MVKHTDVGEIVKQHN